MKKSQEEEEKKLKKILLDYLMENDSGSAGRVAADSDTVSIEALKIWKNHKSEGPLVIAVPSCGTAEQLEHDMGRWAEAAGFHLPIRLLPEGSWKDNMTLEEETERAESLALALSDHPPEVFIGSVLALLSPVPDPNAFRMAETILRRGTVHPMAELVQLLVDLGYDDEPEAVAVGEFSRRGGILDIYSPGMKYPVRLEFFGDEIESIREYSPDSGRSIREIEVCKIIARSGCEPVTGEDYLDFSAYVPNGNLAVFSPGECLDSIRKYGGTHAEDHWRKFQEKLQPEWFMLNEIECAEKGISVRRKCVGAAPALRASAAEEGESETVAELSRGLSAEFVKRALQEKRNVVLTVSQSSDAEHIAEWLNENGITVGKGLSIEYVSIPCGIIFPEKKMIFLTERELFPAYLRTGNRMRRTGEMEEDIAKASAGELENMADIEEGDLTVHLNLGLCRYRGIKTITSGGSSIESLVLEFADDALVYVPVWQAHLVSRYVGSHVKGAHLSKPGSARWAKARADAASSARNLAADMLRIQAVRKSSPGLTFPHDGYEQKLFEDSFPFEETEGQKKAIAEIKADMESERPMDRLLCGDVGYGKTEVAMRAAFKCVSSGRQTAILVPTTVLAQQHYLSFLERFAEYPFTIETLTRLKMGKERKKILSLIASGGIDIIIGTHALIGADVKFHDLGLVIIDEEQRFGVEHKEKLKAVRASVDVLTMTATPIPRTLHMSMTGLRDLSAITTAPVKRLPVHTVVAQQEDSLVASALARELGRGGQVFYIHNRVTSIEKCAEKVRILAPGAKVMTAHGQMRGPELESIMTLFIEGKIDVLVCTTIIESGIDIPNANTMIIERADMFGLAELHQLRGRVGRWSRQAYAYLLLPPGGVMTTDARRRMSAIRRYTHLGAGFQLAVRDMEIRGAGDIIGAEQSGHVDAIGFHLYCQLLREASNAMRGIPSPKRVECDLNLDFLDFALSTKPPKLSAGIPPSYIQEDRLRLAAYRRLAFISSPEELEDYRNELQDKYGKLPDSAERFLKTVRIRIAAFRAGFHAVSSKDGRILLENDSGLFRYQGKIPKVPPDYPLEYMPDAILYTLELAADRKGNTQD